MKTQEEYAREIDEIVRRDVESCQIDWFKIDKEIFMLPENKNKTFILGTRKTGCDLLILGGTNCDEIHKMGCFIREMVFKEILNIREFDINFKKKNHDPE